jgi:hypothetical protein
MADRPAGVPQRLKFAGGEIVPEFPEECEPHTEDPDGYLQWHAWAERMAKAHVQRQCKGCGLWAIWEPRKGASPDGEAGDGG